MVIEVVVYNIESALLAQRGGANRIEVCSNPSEGGTTPSYGLIETIRKNVSIEVFMMVRPRGGDFQYSSHEFDSMKLDIVQCQKLGVDGVVFGILNSNGTIDKSRCKGLIEIARPMKVTFHRAFDMTRDPLEAIEDCIELGFDRILTSGQQTFATDGLELIKTLIQISEEKIIIMPGSGVNEETVCSLIKETGANEIHFSATTFRESRMKYRNQMITQMGSTEGSEFAIRTVDPNKINKIRILAEKVKAR